MDRIELEMKMEMLKMELEKEIMRQAKMKKEMETIKQEEKMELSEEILTEKVNVDASKNLIKAVINQGKRLGGEVINGIKGRSGRDFLEWLEWSMKEQLIKMQEALETGKDDNIGIEKTEITVQGKTGIVDVFVTWIFKIDKKERDKIKANILINIARVYSASQVVVNLNTVDGGITWDASLVDYTE